MNRGLLKGLPRARSNGNSDAVRPIPPPVQGSPWVLSGNASYSSPSVLQLVPTATSQNGTAWLPEILPLDGLTFVYDAIMGVDGTYILLGDPKLDTPTTLCNATHAPFVHWEVYNNPTNPVTSQTGKPYVEMKHPTISGFYSALSDTWQGTTGGPFRAPVSFTARRVMDGYYELSASWGAMVPIRAIMPAPEYVMLGFAATTGGSAYINSVQGFVGQCAAA